jgi:hypothetical protein
MPLILLWLIFAILVGFSAAGQNRSFILWFFIATLISPLLRVYRKHSIHLLLILLTSAHGKVGYI